MLAILPGVTTREGGGLLRRRSQCLYPKPGLATWRGIRINYHTPRSGICSGLWSLKRNIFCNQANTGARNTFSVWRCRFDSESRNTSMLNSFQLLKTIKLTGPPPPPTPENKGHFIHLCLKDFTVLKKCTINEKLVLHGGGSVMVWDWSIKTLKQSNSIVFFLNSYLCKIHVNTFFALHFL